MPSKPDIWMPLYIGDYLAATAHLGALESGAYLHLLMHSWKNGSLPADSESLRRIAKVEKDAWSIAWALLAPFFDHAQGFPVQLRLETIREECKAKQLKAQGKAKAAADVRWRKDAPSNPQALPKQCPSSASSPKEATTLKPSRVKTPREEPTKSDLVKDRHAALKEKLKQYWEYKNPGVEMPWGPAEGKQLAMWMQQSPLTTLEQFTQFLRNRAMSEVNHAERISRWIGNITSYANGPLNTFRQPLNGGKSNGKIETTLNSHEIALANIRSRSAANGAGRNSPEADGDPLLPSSPSKSGVPDGNVGTVIEGEP